MYEIKFYYNKGIDKKMYDKIHNKYYKGFGFGIFKKSEYEELNLMLKNLLDITYKVGRFYNDGDKFKFKGKTIKFDYNKNKELNKNLKEIDKYINKLLKSITLWGD